MSIRRLSELLMIGVLTFCGCSSNAKPADESAEKSEKQAAEDVKIEPADAQKPGFAEIPQADAEMPKPAEAVNEAGVESDSVAENVVHQEIADERGNGGFAAESGSETAEPEQAAANVEAHRIDSLDELSAEQKKMLDDIVWDLDPEVLNAVLAENEGGHFPFSDEKHLDLFRESIENLGGTYMGVGTDQGYLFAGWQRPTLAFMIDYDPWVIAIHQLYIAFWKSCEDSACLHHYFDDRETGMAFITGDVGTAAGLNNKNIIKIYKTTQRSIARQLKRVEKMKVKTFMNDAESFSYLKKLIEQGRLRTFQANLLGDRAFASVSATMKELGGKVTTLYLSNAEQYWAYSAQFKKNITELPVSENGLILRTSATYPVNNDYRYSIQPISVFKAWLNHPDGKTVRQVTKRVKVDGPEDFPFVVDDFMPPVAEVLAEGK